MARRAGVSKGTIYLYFDSKEALFRAMVQAQVGASVTAGEQFVRTFEGPTPQLLQVFLQRYWTVMRQPTQVRLVRVVLAELSHFPELARFYRDEVILRVRRVLTAIIERGVAHGEFRPVSPVLVAQALQVLCVHLTQFPHDLCAAAPADTDVVAGIVDLCLHGLLAASATAPPAG